MNYIDKTATEGATDISECPDRDTKYTCRCVKCSVCGFGKHTAVHGPIMNGVPGGKPWGHKFQEPK